MIRWAVAHMLPWLANNGVPLAAFLYAARWLQRFKTEQITRQRLELASDIGGTAFDLMLAVRDHIATVPSDQTAFQRKLDAALPLFTKSAAQSFVLMRPEVNEKLQAFVDAFQNVEWAAAVTDLKLTDDGYDASAKGQAMMRSKVAAPEEMETAYRDLLEELRFSVHPAGEAKRDRKAFRAFLEKHPLFQTEALRRAIEARSLEDDPGQ